SLTSCLVPHLSFLFMLPPTTELSTLSLHDALPIWAILAPLYGILVTDYYILRKRRLDLQHMYSTSPDGIYWFTRGWNTRALQAGGLAATFSIAAVWVPALADLGGYAWLIGAVLGGLFHWIAMRHHVIVTTGNEH